MYGYIYETTNLVNGKKYIGKRKSNIFLGNEYLGSSIKLRQDIKSLGKDNFSIKLLEECNSLEELNRQEVYWISYYNAVHNDKYYNLSSGGAGSWEKFNNNKEYKHKLIVNSNKRRVISKESRKKNSESQKKLWDKERRELQAEIMRRNNAKRTKDDLERMAEKLRGSAGNTGKKLYNNGIEQKLFREHEVPDGWVKGSLKRSKRWRS